MWGDVYKRQALDRLTMADKWIVSKVNTLTREVTENLDKYELGIALQKVYDFIWEEFCDWYIEMVKPRLYNEEDDTKVAAIWTLKHVLIQALKLLHPFMPFISCLLYTSYIEQNEKTMTTSVWLRFCDRVEISVNIFRHYGLREFLTMVKKKLKRSGGAML